VVVRDKKDLMNTAQVETFVEVKVQYHEKFAMTKRTNVDEGGSPKWNEVLVFPLEADNKTNFTREELINSQTMIIISLFDKQMYVNMQDGKQVRQEENRFLGNLEIPLSTVLNNYEKTDFNFKLNRPLILPAYRVVDDELNLMQNNAKLVDEVLRENEQIATYLNLSISLDPAIELPNENVMSYYPGAEIP